MRRDLLQGWMMGIIGLPFTSRAPVPQRETFMPLINNPLLLKEF